MKNEMRKYFEFNVRKYDDSKDFFVYQPSSLTNPKSNSVMFVMEKYISLSDALMKVDNCLVFWPSGHALLDEIKRKHVIVESDAPRKDYNRFFRDNGIIYYPPKENYQMIDGAYIADKSKIGENCTIMPGSYVGGEVTIGNNVYIGCGAKLVGRITIGDDVVIRENSVIGADGMTTERDIDGSALTMPQFGGVKIGNRVQIGANTVIGRGAIDDTVIGAGSKIDNCCFISHNVVMEENVFVVGETLMMGSSRAERNSYISGNVVVRNKVTIGEDAFVGMGAVVTKDVSSGSTVFGNPARERN